MGQTQSAVAAVDQSQNQSHHLKPLSSMESLVREAVAYGSVENESLDAKAQKALECPCLAELRNGSCGFQFSEAFVCFLKSTTEEKGSDCVRSFIALQNCIKANPNAFSRNILEEELKKEESVAQGCKIYPPRWSQESPRSKSKL